MKIKIILIGLIFSLFFNTGFAETLSSSSIINEKAILKNARNLSPTTLSYALKGYHWALKKREIKNPDILTVIDFTLPSNAKRMWVINLRTNKVLMNLYTTHGKGSGTTYAAKFSNQCRTNESSLGTYETLNAYRGAHGYSERVKGLENGVNSNAYRRAIVVHPAWYATNSFIKQYNRAGRSWGCFGIDPRKTAEFVNYTKNGTIIFVYANPEKRDSIINS